MLKPLASAIGAQAPGMCKSPCLFQLAVSVRIATSLAVSVRIATHADGIKAPSCESYQCLIRMLLRLCDELPMPKVDGVKRVW